MIIKLTYEELLTMHRFTVLFYVSVLVADAFCSRQQCDGGGGGKPKYKKLLCSTVLSFLAHMFSLISINKTCNLRQLKKRERKKGKLITH